MNSRGFSLQIALLIVLIVSVLGFAGYYVYDRQSQKAEQNSSQQTSETPAQETESAEPEVSRLPEGWKEYDATELGFVLPYPAEWGEPKVERTEMPHNGKSYMLSFPNKEVYGMINSSDFKYTGAGRGVPSWYIASGSYLEESSVVVAADRQARLGDSGYSTDLLASTDHYVIDSSFDCVNGTVPVKMIVKLNSSQVSVMSIADPSRIIDTGEPCAMNGSTVKSSSLIDKRSVEQFKQMGELLR